MLACKGSVPYREAAAYRNRNFVGVDSKTVAQRRPAESCRQCFKTSRPESCGKIRQHSIVPLCRRSKCVCRRTFHHSYTYTERCTQCGAANRVHACTHELGVIRLLDARGGTANDAAANSFLKDAVEADSEACRSTSQTN